MKKYTLERKIQTSFILMFTGILLVIMLVTAGVIRKIYWGKSYRMCEELVNVNLDLLNSRIMDIQRTQEIIAKNAAVKEAVTYFSGREEKDYLVELQIQRKLDDIFYTLERGEGIWNAYLTDTKGVCLYAYIRSLKLGQDMREKEWYADLISQIKMNTCYISDVHDRSYLVTENDGECVSMVVPIQTGSGYVFAPEAYLVCDIDLNQVFYKSAETGDTEFALMDGNGYLYSREPLEITEEEIEAGKDRETRSIILSRTSRLYGWQVIGVKNLTELRAVDFSLAAVFVFTLLISVIAIILLSRQISREERNLSMEQMKVLQHQINPHFLNNVLQAIKAMALDGENEKISRIATLLGKFLSYSVYRPYENVRLEEELNYLETYMEIQNIRYGGNLLYSVFCEEGLKDAVIPKLTLQPVVENAIEHGYEGKGKLLLDIDAEPDGTDAEICIHDNGKGIPSEALACIRAGLEKGEMYRSKQSIGIINVNERLKKLYGGIYGLTITSNEGAGTTVIIRIPGRREMEHDEITDCGR